MLTCNLRHKYTTYLVLHLSNSAKETNLLLSWNSFTCMDNYRLFPRMFWLTLSILNTNILLICLSLPESEKHLLCILWLTLCRTKVHQRLDMWGRMQEFKYPSVQLLFSPGEYIKHRHLDIIFPVILQRVLHLFVGLI